MSKTSGCINLFRSRATDFPPGVDKTRNTEHSGTVPEHEKITIIFMKKKEKKLDKQNNNNKIIFVKINNNKIT